jgi:hypothetical protein
MRKYDEWKQLQNKKGRMIVEHALFGAQTYACDDIKIVNDERVGVTIKGSDLFVRKENIKSFEVKDNEYVVEDEMLAIRVIVNKV